ncbi:MAG: hypothetical protein V1915_04950 [Candidatus Bathyarchaeota archaeon]
MLKKFRNVFSVKEQPLEEKIPLVIMKLESSLNKLDRTSAVLIKEDQDLFERCVEARVKNDYVHAVMYANECVEMRKITHLVISSKYALEQMILRLQTVIKLGDILVTMTPVIDVVKNTRNRLVGLVPSVANSLTEANQILGKCMDNMGTSNVPESSEVLMGQDALKVMKEADQAAENVLREKFPSIPNTDLPTLRQFEMLGT